MITILYAGILGVLSLVLASIAGNMRGKKQISVGDGGDQEMLLAMRRHGNFVEYVPLALVLIWMLETQGVSPTAIHSLGIALVVTRAVHAFGLKADTLSNPARFIGAAGTALTVAVASIWAIVSYL
ncbi:MAG: MAPEG family protein [Pseudomonadota bacterium]